jgi:hypothetical protein
MAVTPATVGLTESQVKLVTELRERRPELTSDSAAVRFIIEEWARMLSNPPTESG